MQIQLDDVSVSYVDTGRGAAPSAEASSQDGSSTILFLHGFPLDHSMWDRQIDSLRHAHRCIAPDLRGFGGSSFDGGVSSMSQLAKDMIQLLDRLSIGEPVTLCGLSMGGYIAFEMWQHEPSKIARMILCDTRAEPDSHEVARGREMMALQVEQDGMDGVANGMIPKLLAPSTVQTQSETTEKVRQMIDDADPRAVAAAQRGMAKRCDSSDRLASIQIPALVVCGEHDRITPPESMRDLTAALPNGSFLEISDAGHLAPFEQPDAVNRAIGDWLAN